MAPRGTAEHMLPCTSTYMFGSRAGAVTSSTPPTVASTTSEPTGILMTSTDSGASTATLIPPGAVPSR